MATINDNYQEGPSTAPRFLVGIVGNIVDLFPREPYNIPFQYPVPLSSPKNVVWCVFNDQDVLMSVHETILGASEKCSFRQGWYYESFIVEK